MTNDHEKWKHQIPLRIRSPYYFLPFRKDSIKKKLKGNSALVDKLSATKKLGVGEKVSVIAKTTVVDIGTTSELGFGKRRLAHVLGMYGTILFWVSSIILVFCYRFFIFSFYIYCGLWMTHVNDQSKHYLVIT